MMSRVSGGAGSRFRPTSENPTIFPLRMAQGAFLECSGRALAPYPAVSPGAAFLGAGRFIAISGGGRLNNLA